MGVGSKELSYPAVADDYIGALGSALENSYERDFDVLDLDLGRHYVDEFMDLFWGYDAGMDEHYVIFLSQDQGEVDNDVIEEFSGHYHRITGNPDDQDVDNFESFAESNFEDRRELNGSAVFAFDDPYLGGGATLHMQLYIDPEDELVHTGTTGKGANKIERLEDDIAKDTDKDSFGDFWDKVFYDAEQQLSNWNVIQGNGDLDQRGFQYLKDDEIPETVNPEYGGTNAELWQIPASKTGLGTSEGFIQVWRPEANDLVVSPTAEIDDEEGVEAAKSLLSG